MRMPSNPSRCRRAACALEPLALTTKPASKPPRADGELWNLRITSVPAPRRNRAPTSQPPCKGARQAATCCPSR